MGVETEQGLHQSIHALSSSRSSSIVSVQLMDKADPPESLLSVGDGRDGWGSVVRLNRHRHKGMASRHEPQFMCRICQLRLRRLG